ncbi:MAG TPA: LytTR family DNA-binding domain-containing protein [Bacteroidia bacterium]|nr:LytTR family DNA-binding domain-containing protein [Bacteroidia bacterium]
MKLTAIAIDDEPPALSIIEEFASRREDIDLQKTFTKPTEAIRHLRKFPVDLVFLDIKMPSISGLELFKDIPENTQVIFTTAHSEYAVEGFNLKAADYLLKPISFERFEQAIDKVIQMAQLLRSSEEKGANHLLVRADYSLIKIGFSEIAYVEGLDDYVKIHLDTGKMVVARMTMKKMQERLPATGFVRVHRSFIVPFSRIESVRNKTIFMKAAQVPLGASYEADFYKVYTGE